MGFGTCGDQGSILKELGVVRKKSVSWGKGILVLVNKIIGL